MLESLFNKVALQFLGLQFYLKENPTQVLSCEYCEILKNICKWLLYYIYNRPNFISCRFTLQDSEDELVSLILTDDFQI